MAEQVLNWGLLSTARINRALIPMLQKSKRNRVTAVASRDMGKATAYAREWKIPRALGCYEALIDDPEIQVIYNPLPNALHAEWSIKALRAGKHVLCEKPLGMSVEEVDAMAAASRQAGKVLAEAFMYRHHPQTRRVKEFIDGGAVGKLQVIKGAFTFSLKREGDVRLVQALGGGSIWDVGCYPISYARMIAGAEPVEVFGRQIAEENGVDVAFAGMMRFPGNEVAQFDCGFRSPERKYVEIIGTEGSLYVAAPFNPRTNEKIEIRGAERSQTIIVGGEDLYRGEVEDMADAALNGEAPRVSLADSRGNVAAIAALLESARTGKPTPP
jgi:xylose dehydrogenase (NAD/NADP)